MLLHANGERPTAKGFSILYSPFLIFLISMNPFSSVTSVLICVLFLCIFLPTHKDHPEDVLTANSEQLLKFLIDFDFPSNAVGLVMKSCKTSTSWFTERRQVDAAFPSWGTLAVRLFLTSSISSISSISSTSSICFTLPTLSGSLNAARLLLSCVDNL
jgi:hypothetical protein